MTSGDILPIRIFAWREVPALLYGLTRASAPRAVMWTRNVTVLPAPIACDSARSKFMSKARATQQLLYHDKTLIVPVLRNPESCRWSLCWIPPRRLQGIGPETKGPTPAAERLEKITIAFFERWEVDPPVAKHANKNAFQDRRSMRFHYSSCRNPAGHSKA